RADFSAFVTEPGDVVSSNNVEVRCQVESRGSAGIAIVDICEEGAQVLEGDLLIQFDDSVLQNELVAQKIVVAQDKAAFIQAESNLANAERTLREYVDGLYQQEAEVLEGEVFVAEEVLRKNDLLLASNRRLAARGLIKPLQVTASEFALEKSRKDVAAAQRALDVYRRFTREKKVGEYTAEIEKQKANLEAAQFTLDLSKQKLSDIEEQIAHCTVTAPSAGQVVYANDRNKGDPTVIEEGTLIRYHQVVVRLPDVREMQVDVKINESHINRIKPNMPARIILDADPENVLDGVVTSVAPYPFPMRWHGSPLEYGVKVGIIDPPETIRPGLRAKVQIYFDSQPDALLVPLAAVIAHEGKHYCLLKQASGWKPRQVQIGPNNNNQVVVTEGLREGDQVSLTPFRHIERADLAESPLDLEAVAGDQALQQSGRRLTASESAALLKTSGS
ncbi:MAG: HlyD family efflux transporter periplasmic adaptor subunit, partial [Pirellulales bacterium]|nr:HlyD family efflux transporter periplasmic adaptor subunit [Pirellulales bacterium]